MDISMLSYTFGLTINFSILSIFPNINHHFAWLADDPWWAWATRSYLDASYIDAIWPAVFWMNDSAGRLPRPRSLEAVVRLFIIVKISGLIGVKTSIMALHIIHRYMISVILWCSDLAVTFPFLKMALVARYPLAGRHLWLSELMGRQ